MSEELVLLPEVEARRILRGERIRLQVLVPPGVWTGCGSLRVLRMKINDDRTFDLVAGYESYQP
ncbi:MAG: hypothetical protein WB757_16295 [Candidatus Cybelea sp.]